MSTNRQREEANKYNERGPQHFLAFLKMYMYDHSLVSVRLGSKIRAMHPIARAVTWVLSIFFSFNIYMYVCSLAAHTKVTSRRTKEYRTQTRKQIEEKGKGESEPIYCKNPQTMHQPIVGQISVHYNLNGLIGELSRYLGMALCACFGGAHTLPRHWSKP